jgi:hypothetical protein
MMLRRHSGRPSLSDTTLQVSTGVARLSTFLREDRSRISGFFAMESQRASSAVGGRRSVFTRNAIYL